MYYLLDIASLHGFADDHTISASSRTLSDLKTIICDESNKAIDWLKSNAMIANPSKFQAIVFSKSNDPIKTDFQISDKVITSDKSVELLGITFDYKLNFSTHIDKLCKKKNWPVKCFI